MPNWNDGPKLNLNGLTEFKQKLDELFAKKADNNGHYSDLTSGNAEQLISTAGIEDRVPYNFRRSGGGADIGDREVDKIVGGTIAWNQQMKYGQFGSDYATYWDVYSGTGSVSNGELTVTNAVGRNGARIRAVAAYLPALVTNHVYFISIGYKSTVTLTSYCVFGGINLDPTDTWETYTKIDRRSRTGTDYANCDTFPSTANEQGTFSLRDIQIFDLTQMFGSAIADQILAMETATAGAGVAYFKSLFPKAYYPYNAGELMSVQTAGKETVGVNQWDEVSEQGAIDMSTGNPTTSTSNYRSKNFVPVLPNTSYCYYNPNATSGVRIVFYDNNHNRVSSISNSNPVPQVFTTPANAAYLKFYWGNINGVCINFSNAYKNGTYEPYTKHTYPLDSSLTLRGIPKLDANNKLYYDGDTYESDGTVTRRYGVVDLGTLTWGGSNSFGGSFSATLVEMEDSTAQSICSKYPNVFSGSEMTNGDKLIYTVNNGRVIYCKDTSYSDAATFKTAMSGVYLVYELSTPTTEIADPFQQVQVCSPYGTERYLDAGEGDVQVPVGHDTFYPENLRAKIEGLPWDMSMLAPIENGATASQAYAQGKYFMRNNQFCKAKTEIASGATFTLGTNYEVTTVAAELFALNS